MPLSQDLPTERRRSALSRAIFGTAEHDLLRRIRRPAQYVEREQSYWARIIEASAMTSALSFLNGDRVYKDWVVK
jgi:hypothetical protein